MDIKQQKNRVAYIDLAKGITIFLVIVGHAVPSVENAPFYTRFLYSFHMPLFFFLAGMLMKPRPQYNRTVWKKLLSKYTLVLMVPYLLWGILYADFSYVNIGRIVYGSWLTLGRADTLTSLWYIPCLFIVRIQMNLLFWLYKKIKADSRVLAVITSVITFIIAFLIPKNEQFGYPWCFDITFMALGFVLLGYAFKGLLDKLNAASMKWLVVGSIVSGAALLAGTVLRSEKLIMMLMCNSVYGAPLEFFWNAVWGSVLVLLLSMIIGKYVGHRWVQQIQYVGQNTFAIYLLHKPILQKLIMLPLGLLGITAEDCPVVVAASFVTLLACCWFMRVIDKWFPQLLGKFPEPNVKVVENAENA